CCGLVVNVGLNLFLIPRMVTQLGPGGGGVGCALAMVGTEIFVTTTMASFVGRGALNRGTLAMVGKCVAACVATVIVDRAASPLGWARLILDAAAYLTVVLTTGALRVGDVVANVQTALRGRSQGLVRDRA